MWIYVKSLFFWALFIIDVEVDPVMEKEYRDINSAVYYHTMPTEKVLESLNTTKTGLIESEALVRLEKCGKN